MIDYLPLTVLGITENTVFVNPKSQENIIELKVPKNHVAFLYRLIIDKYFPDVEYQLYIDGNYVMSFRREGEFKFDPPFVAKRSIRVVGVNMSNNKVPLGVFVDGLVIIS